VANENRNAFVVVRGDGSYFSGFVGGGLGQAVFSSRLSNAELYSSIAVASRFKNMLDDGVKIKQVDLNLRDVE
tara:strand:+ start:3015 stop:3233 length:219 start_codon:yes stop_codon:yes gene_type:complete